MKMYVRIGFHRLCSVRVLHRHTNHLHLIRSSASANQNRFLTFCFNFNALADLFPPNQSSLAKSLSITSIRSNRKSTQVRLHLHRILELTAATAMSIFDHPSNRNGSILGFLTTWLISHLLYRSQLRHVQVIFTPLLTRISSISFECTPIVLYFVIT